HPTRRPPRPPLFPYTTLFRSRWHPGEERPRSHRRDPETPPGGLDLRRRDLLAALLRGRVLLDRLAPRDVRAHHHLRRRFQDLGRSEEHTSELQSRFDLVCRLL